MPPQGAKLFQGENQGKLKLAEDHECDPLFAGLEWCLEETGSDGLDLG